MNLRFRQILYYYFQTSCKREETKSKIQYLMYDVSRRSSEFIPFLTIILQILEIITTLLLINFNQQA